MSHLAGQKRVHCGKSVYRIFREVQSGTWFVQGCTTKRFLSRINADERGSEKEFEIETGNLK
jgi:hypothetical protein